MLLSLNALSLASSQRRDLAIFFGYFFLSSMKSSCIIFSGQKLGLSQSSGNTFSLIFLSTSPLGNFLCIRGIGGSTLTYASILGSYSSLFTSSNIKKRDAGVEPFISSM
ncbi:108aa long hypothetical protein [Pyrococcus horikoshii OT3]|uniref:Uncharacterized protein n=1 Tax=Pyrococcus horikoshii (strain ATCC 700860 / DSM 12428 / JCM 9974 / NBRC 100139 / OT-3) TaxID=70601 RepID=O59177_PYRHO|nr:108aa long hypothetical protein [Pyrococcus horikoshii OT3]